MTHAFTKLESGAETPTRDDRALETRLTTWFREHGSVLIGFSGGVDSAYLACTAVAALGAERVLAVIGRSASYPSEQWERARAVARQFGVPVLEVSTDEVNDPRYAANPSNRCYFCKTELWDTLAPIARERGIAVVVDGTNADDLGDHRPGARAAAEHHVHSPLAELGFSKDAIRRLSRARGIPTWSQPASPCLSSRIPYGTAVTIDRLRQIERAERALRQLGFHGDLRVRYHGDLARVEIAADLLGEWLRPEGRAAICQALRDVGFERVTIDARGFRSGSLNVLGGVLAEPLVRSRSASGGGDARGLERALERRGFGFAVEARDRLAILRANDTLLVDRLVDSAARHSVVEAARGQGFSHVGIDVGDAALHRG
ncbi:MAG TPA: ATP-dependent sacrificial sulfur transferase LarE [Gemmatimonadaceae bacterium]|nr:ATP-dependent sacrificial sulfur transferase LarE [Gemmatimonadaceae bacterium]